jgi:hypothetical protein
VKILLVTTVLALSTASLGCKKKENVPDAGAAAAAPKAQAPAARAPAAPLPMVQVAADGTTFKPPVQVSQIPAGAFYCHMGTVEYARMTPGDGKCPVCGMKLKKKM